MTLTPDNCNYLFESLKYFQEQGFENCNIIPNEFDNWNEEHFKIIEDQMILIKDYIIQTFEQEEIPLVPKILEQMFCKRVIKEYEEGSDGYVLLREKRPSLTPLNADMTYHDLKDW